MPLFKKVFAVTAAAVAVALAVVNVHAQSSVSVSSNGNSASDSPVYSPEYTRPKCKWPNWYTAQLIDNYRSGQVTLDCAFSSNGVATSCKVISESSRGAGKVVADSFLCFAHIDPTAVEGGLHDGDRHKFTYRW